MTDQPTLFEVPKTPTRKEQLDAFKAANGIWTHFADGLTEDECPWMAMILPSNPHGIKLGHEAYCKSDEPMDILAGYCRIMDEAGFIAYGTSEEQSILDLCRQNEIQFHATELGIHHFPIPKK